MKRKVLKQLVCVLGIVFMTFPAWSAVPSSLLPDDGSLNQTPLTDDFDDGMMLAAQGGGGGQGGGGQGGENSGGNGGSGGNGDGTGQGDGSGDGSGDNCSGDGTCDGEQVRNTVRRNERTQNQNTVSDPQGETVQMRNVMRDQHRNMNGDDL